MASNPQKEVRMKFWSASSAAKALGCEERVLLDIMCAGLIPVESTEGDEIRWDMVGRMRGVA